MMKKKDSLNILLLARNSTEKGIKLIVEQIKRIYHSFNGINLYLYSFIPFQSEMNFIKQLDPKIELKMYFKSKHKDLDLIMIDDLSFFNLDFILFMMYRKTPILVDKLIAEHYSDYFIPEKTVLTYSHSLPGELPFKILNTLKRYESLNKILTTGQKITLTAEIQKRVMSVIEDMGNLKEDYLPSFVDESPNIHIPGRRVNKKRKTSGVRPAKRKNRESKKTNKPDVRKKLKEEPKEKTKVKDTSKEKKEKIISLDKLEKEKTTRKSKSKATSRQNINNKTSQINEKKQGKGATPVDLVIINYNTLSYLRNCINSIRQNTLYPHRIIVVDNGSSDGSVKYLKGLKDVTLILNNSNYGYGKAANQGISISNGKYVVILNSDLKLTRGWLKNMVQEADKDDTIGVLGPKMVNQDNLIVGAGVTRLNSVPSSRGWLKSDTRGLFDKVTDCYSVGGACYMIRRKALEQVGGFDQNYFFYFEETDLSLRMLEKGYRVVYCPTSKIIHYHEGSLDQDDYQGRLTRNKYFKESQRLFLKKWGDVIAGQPKRKKSRDIVVFGVIPWNFRYQRPQQICSRLADKGYRIIYINSVCQRGGKLERVSDNIYSFSPDGRGLVYQQLRYQKSKEIMVDSINNIFDQLDIVNPILWVDVPYWQEVLTYFDRSFIIYDCMDSYQDFSDLKRYCPGIEDYEKKLAQAAELVLTSSQELEEKLMSFNNRTVLLPNGVDKSHFHSLDEKKSLYTMSKIPQPIIGYHGAIAEWMDLELIRHAARLLPNYSFVFIGQTTVDISSLKRRDNIYFLGEQPYSKLPEYLQYFKVGLIPFIKNKLTLSTNPVKLYEYLAAGIPVVSVDLPEIQQFKDVVYISHRRQQFVNMIERAVKEDSEWKRRKRIKRIEKEDWNNRVDKILDELNLLQRRGYLQSKMKDLQEKVVID